MVVIGSRGISYLVHYRQVVRCTLYGFDQGQTSVFLYYRRCVFLPAPSTSASSRMDIQRLHLHRIPNLFLRAVDLLKGSHGLFQGGNWVYFLIQPPFVQITQFIRQVHH